MLPTFSVFTSLTSPWVSKEWLSWSVSSTSDFAYDWGGDISPFVPSPTSSYKASLAEREALRQPPLTVEDLIYTGPDLEARPSSEDGEGSSRVGAPRAPASLASTEEAYPRKTRPAGEAR